MPKKQKFFEVAYLTQMEFVCPHSSLDTCDQLEVMVLWVHLWTGRSIRTDKFWPHRRREEIREFVYGGDSQGITTSLDCVARVRVDSGRWRSVKELNMDCMHLCRDFLPLSSIKEVLGGHRGEGREFGEVLEATE
uniref:Putative 1,3 beta-glucan synthase n=1 Tax=Papaver somniferum TaxID=3469 RepID=A0A5B7LJQ8_PAPSO|nr:putative 1,3 beta-glucan synthase [Papaver somniferum]